MTQKYYRHSLGDTIRAMRRPTKLDKLIEETIPKPKEAIPNFGLPRWQTMPLDYKIPLIPAPKNAYHFSRNKIGKSLLFKSQNVEFKMDDPYNYQINIPYNSLHDKYLAKYFSKKSILKYLMKREMVTKNLDAICTIGEYNMYRKYLKNLISDRVKEELNYQCDLQIDKRVLEKAEIVAQKDTEKAKLQERKNIIKIKKFCELMTQEQEKVKKKKIKAARDNIHIQKIEQNKKERLEQIILKSKQHSENVKRKHTMMIRKRQNRLINNLVKRARREKKRVKIMREKRIEEADQQRQNLELKWQRKLLYQRQQIATENYLNEYLAKCREIWIQNYHKQIEQMNAVKKSKNDNHKKTTIKPSKVAKTTKKEKKCDNLKKGDAKTKSIKMHGKCIEKKGSFVSQNSCRS